ncbi:hypothetical protein bcgnr5390_15240 [Bacillus luti]|nr:hypothetical protein BC2903_46330 [Bacillus cereus]
MNLKETCTLLMSHPKIKDILFDVITNRTIKVQAVFLSHVSYRDAGSYLEGLTERMRYDVCKQIAELHRIPKWEMQQIIKEIVDEVNIRVNHGVKKDYYSRNTVSAQDTMNGLYRELSPKLKAEMEESVAEEGIHMR